jgi:hypothetical protein
MTRFAWQFFAVIIAARVGATQAPAPKAIPDEPSCARCSISMQKVVTLGTDDGVGSLNGKPMSLNVDSQGRYWLFQELEPATVFGANGTVDRMIGRKGNGPGEFQSSNHGIIVGDSMLVFDWVQSRATMIDPDLLPRRTIRIAQSVGDVVPIEWPSLLVTHGHFPTSTPPNSVMHRISLADTEMRLLGSFGPLGTGGPMGNVEVQQRMGRGRDGIWSAYAGRPAFTKWDRNGRAIAAFTRPLDWFTGQSPATIGWGRSAPTPMTALIGEDESGLVWLFIYRPAPNWKEAWVDVRPVRVGGGSEIRARDVQYDKLMDTYIEVIDPTQGRVIARHNFDGYIFEALPGRKVAQYVVDASGIPRVHILSLTLNGRQ